MKHEFRTSGFRLARERDEHRQVLYVSLESGFRFETVLEDLLHEFTLQISVWSEGFEEQGPGLSTEVCGRVGRRTTTGSAYPG